LLLAYGIDDQVTVDGFFGANPTGSIAQFQFSNGVTLTQADVVALVSGGNTAPALTGPSAILASGTEDMSQSFLRLTYCKVTPMRKAIHDRY